jgi:DNA replication protein DnaC
MKKNELQELVQECIAEVLDERKSKGDDEFKRVDKGEKGKVAKDKGEEEVYGAGYAAGERAAKKKYKKLAEAYMTLKEEGFGLNKDMEESSTINKDIFDNIDSDLMEGGLEPAEQIQYLKDVISHCQSAINTIEQTMGEDNEDDDDDYYGDESEYSPNFNGGDGPDD